jgi:hypothetical protein
MGGTKPKTEMIEELLDLNTGSQETAVIAQYFSLVQAEIAAAALRDADINCFLANTETNALGLGQNAVRLHADIQKATEAKAIIDALVFTETDYHEPLDAASPSIVLWLIGIILATLTFVGYKTFM